MTMKDSGLHLFVVVVVAVVFVVVVAAAAVVVVVAAAAAAAAAALSSYLLDSLHCSQDLRTNGCHPSVRGCDHL